MRCEREGVDGVLHTTRAGQSVCGWGGGRYGGVRGCLQYVVHCTLLGPGTVRVCVWVGGCGCACVWVCMCVYAWVFAMPNCVSVM